ncbi:unnamed protein product [Chrysodeixis includens]|uniref:Uncharacterized protein n=1 Tax=Chrysodeixis includens TaxID=689277 RepID=A0A9P0FTE2_CHRIL|nr:unnamed protein product [Chrysodeixis includens]
MDESEDNLSSEDLKSSVSPLNVKSKPKKRSLIERELETSLTARVTSPVSNGDGTSTSRYGRARRLKTDTELADAKKVTPELKSPLTDKSPVRQQTQTQSPVYKMHASNSPLRTETPKKVGEETFLENQIESIYQENISLSRFGTEEVKASVPSPAKKFPKVYIRTDLIQKRESEENSKFIKNMFSLVKSAEKSSSTHLNNILERSSERYSLSNTKQQNGYLDNSSVVKTLDFDGKKKKKDSKDVKGPSKSELFELEAKCAYQVGDLAWARMGTYPFWPCIVTRDPSNGVFVKKKLFGRIERDVIHVTFFGDNGRRGWIVDTMLRKYLGQLEFESTRDNFTPEDKKKDPRLYAAYFVSEKKQALWNASVEESEMLLREPKRLRIDIFNDMLEKSRIKAKPQKSGKISRTDSDVSLSESLYDSLFSEDDGKVENNDRSKNRTRNKSLDVFEVVTACLDNMAAKTGITKIQRQSHMDRWLQKAKSKTPEKTQTKPQVPSKVDEKKSTKTKASKSKKSVSKVPLNKPYSLRKSMTESQNLLPFQNEHDYSKHVEVTDSDYTSTDTESCKTVASKKSKISIITKAESQSDKSIESDKGEEIVENKDLSLVDGSKDNVTVNGSCDSCESEATDENSQDYSMSSSALSGNNNTNKSQSSGEDRTIQESSESRDTVNRDQMVSPVYEDSYSEDTQDSQSMVYESDGNENTDNIDEKDDEDGEENMSVDDDSTETPENCADTESESQTEDNSSINEKVIATDSEVQDDVDTLDSDDVNVHTSTDQENVQERTDKDGGGTENITEQINDLKEDSLDELMDVDTNESLSENLLEKVDRVEENSSEIENTDQIPSDTQENGVIENGNHENCVPIESNEFITKNDEIVDHLTNSSVHNHNNVKEIDICSAQEVNIPSIHETIKENGFHEENNHINGDLDFDTASIHSEDSVTSTKSESKRKLRSKAKEIEDPLENPEFVKFLELRQDAIMDEYPSLNQAQIVAYLHKTWLYEESVKSDDKKNDALREMNLVKGLNSEPARKKNLSLNRNSMQKFIHRKRRGDRETIKENGISDCDSLESCSRDTTPDRSESEGIKNKQDIRNYVSEVTNNKKDSRRDTIEETNTEIDSRIEANEETSNKQDNRNDISEDSGNIKDNRNDIIEEHNEEDSSNKNSEVSNYKSDSRTLTIEVSKKQDILSNETEIALGCNVQSEMETDVQDSEVRDKTNGTPSIQTTNTDNKQTEETVIDTSNVVKLSFPQEPETNTFKEDFDGDSVDSEDSETPLIRCKLRSKTKKAMVFREDDVKVKDEELDTMSINSEDSEISITKRKKKFLPKKVENAMEDPEFVKYLELRQDALIDENPQLTQEEIVAYLYQTWLYEENTKSEIKKCDEIEQSGLVKGLKDAVQQQPKKIKRKVKTEKELEKEFDDDVIPKEKPKRKVIKPYYNEEYSDVEEELEVFSVFKKKPSTDGGDNQDMEHNQEINNIDEIELYFEELTLPKPNIFKGLIREKVCEICYRSGHLVKCKGCNGMFHVDCVKKEKVKVETPIPSRGRKRKKKPGRKPKNPDDSDDKSQDVSEEFNASIEEVLESESYAVDADTFESQLQAKMKDILPDAEKYEYDSYSSDDGIDWSEMVPGKCEIIDIKLKPRHSYGIDFSDFKCRDCQKYDTPVCFVCKSAVSKKEAKRRQKCHVAHCHKYYHLDCLDHWPQTQFNGGEPSKTNKKIDEYFEALTCPRHVCHTCVSDDPRGCKTRFSGDKLARCVKCPATYHSFTKCLPAGTQILTASHIICPRHYEHKPGKVPCHVNTGWCFICALGGSLICCEYCPTSFHAECLNIKPPEGGYMCEDCETGRLPLYGEMVWVKLGHYRWWPGIILHPSEIPENILAAKHNHGEFVVRFFGQYDHYWVNRGRVFPFQEGDSGRVSSQKSKIDAAFTTAMEHAQRACEILKSARPNEEESQDIAQSLLPPHYVKLKVNRPCGSLCGRRLDDPEGSLTQCECNPNDDDPCGPYSQCLNRVLLTECGPTCRAGERCNNRAFEKRLYPKLVPYRTPSRGWGLKTLEDIKAGQFVIEYVGELIDEEEFRRRMRRKHEIRDENFYFLTLDKERMIDAGPKGNLARFMNHCCEPNCETQKWTVLGDVRVGLFALYDIPANSEVTFNYNLECAGIEKKRCMCGAKRCSGYIGAKPKQEESQAKKQKIPGKRTYKKRKPTEESPSTKNKPKRPIGRPPKPRELTEIEKDLLIIRNATNGLSSDESSRSMSSEYERNLKPLKRKRVSFSTEEIILYDGIESPNVKKMKLEDKDVGD